MLKYKIPGNGVNFKERLSVVQRRAGINVTGELDFETKKLFVIPRCGNTDGEYEPHLLEERSRRSKLDIYDNFIERMHSIKQVSAMF